MNNKQLISMWVGIILIASYGIFLVFDRPRLDAPIFLNILVWSLVVSLVTGGFMVTFKDKPKDE